MLPKAAHLIGSDKIAFGGWVSQMVDQLSQAGDIDLSVVCKTPLVSEVEVHNFDRVTYYFVPENKLNKFDCRAEDCQYVLSHCNPDLLHAEGTEQKFTFRMLSMWNGKNIVSMQGILNGYEPYEFGLIPMEKLLFSWSPMSWMFAFSALLNKYFRFKPRLKFEQDTIGLAQNIFGRTLWDRAHSYSLNKHAAYYHCSRTLRPIFYTARKPRTISKHSIFIGNASNPRKGAHYVVEAIQLLVSDFPDIKVYFAGNSPFPRGILDIKKKIGYPNYLLNLIRKHKLEKHIEFTGVLSEIEMCERLESAEIFVMPSTIENSPNTLGEAMILGVPCISAFIGGIGQMAKDEEEILYYRDNDPVYLAYQIKRLFTNRNLYEKLSENGQKRARNNHDKDKNFKDLINAYHTILDVK